MLPYGYWCWFCGYGYWCWFGFPGFGFKVQSVDDDCSEAVGVSPRHDNFVLNVGGDFGIDDDGF